MLMDVFIKGDVYIDYPFEAVKFRYDKPQVTVENEKEISRPPKVDFGK